MQKEWRGIDLTNKSDESYPELYSHVFSPSVLRRMIYEPKSVFIDWLTKAEDSFSWMMDTHRNEYVYQSLLFNKLLLGKHSLNTTSAFSEFWIEKSRADIVMINGEAVVYEIKTDLDNLDRLTGQLNDYYKAFPKVVIVCGEGILSRVCDKLHTSPTGILCLKKNGQFTEIKKAEAFIEALDNVAIFHLLRKPEYCELLNRIDEVLPVCKQVDFYQECKKKVLRHKVSEVFQNTMDILKNRDRIIKGGTYKNVPYSLRALVYFSNLSRKERKRFFDLAE